MLVRSSILWTSHTWSKPIPTRNACSLAFSSISLILAIPFCANKSGFLFALLKLGQKFRTTSATARHGHFARSEGERAEPLGPSFTAEHPRYQESLISTVPSEDDTNWAPIQERQQIVLRCTDEEAAFGVNWFLPMQSRKTIEAHVVHVLIYVWDRSCAP